MFAPEDEKITQEDFDHTIAVFSEVWEKQGARIEGEWIVPIGKKLDDAIADNTASKLETFIVGIKFFAKSFKKDWKMELENFKKDALQSMTEESMKKKVIEKFEKGEGFDWSHQKYLDSEGNIHTVIARSDFQVVTKVGESFMVWYKASASTVPTDISELKMVSPYDR